MATIGNTASGPITDPVADRYLAVADLADAIAERPRAEVARLGFSAAEVSLMAPADAHYHLDRDPASGTHSLVGDWIDARGARLGILLFHADGSFYVEHDVLRPSGSPGIYGVVHFLSAAVGVVATDDAGRLLLVGQHRYALDEYSWEIPEGGVGAGEALEAGARRELREETGYEADRWRHLCRITVSNSVTDERGAIFVASGLHAGVATPDMTEDLALRWATLDDVLAEIDAGEIHDLITIAGVCRYALEVRGA